MRAAPAPREHSHTGERCCRRPAISRVGERTAHIERAPEVGALGFGGAVRRLETSGRALTSVDQPDRRDWPGALALRPQALRQINRGTAAGAEDGTLSVGRLREHLKSLWFYLGRAHEA